MSRTRIKSDSLDVIANLTGCDINRIWKKNKNKNKNNTMNYLFIVGEVVNFFYHY